MKHFFISYNSNDRRWAEWIAWTLEEEGFDVVIQAWDFVGNWVGNMDRAMREAERTIAVLSPNFVNAVYTQSEWQNAFLLDPTGEKDLLIPVRVAPVDLSGLLAQIVYVDIVGKEEREAAEILLKRVRRERLKPVARPAFPGGATSEGHARRSIAVNPGYPAKAEDDKRLLRARDAIVRWRGLYGTQLKALRDASERARVWMKTPPIEPDDEVIRVIDLAGKVAEDFGSLPIAGLEFCNAYGLQVHETVFWGQALQSTATAAQARTTESLAAHQRLNAVRRERGLKPLPLLPNAYTFEMIARVLESALALARFNVDRLPRGFVTGSASTPPRDVSGDVHLVLARVDADPALHVFRADGKPNSVGTFTARSLALHGLCAQRSTAGSIDVVATDRQHLYFWCESGQTPTMQYSRPPDIEHAQFLSREPRASAAIVDSHGGIVRFSPDGGQEVLCAPCEGARHAKLWIDSIDPRTWCILSLDREDGITSRHLGAVATRRVAGDLWNDSVFGAENETSRVEAGLRQQESVSASAGLWGSTDSAIHIATLNGLPCAILERMASWGSGLCFLDPMTLVSLRRPLAIRDSVSGLSVAGGRWLVVTLLKRHGEGRNRILVWDLEMDTEAPVGGWFPAGGDVYAPIVVEENAESFVTVQVFRTLESFPRDNFFELVRFEWPSGKVDRLQRFETLQIWPLSSKTPA